MKKLICLFSFISFGLMAAAQTTPQYYLYSELFDGFKTNAQLNNLTATNCFKFQNLSLVKTNTTVSNPGAVGSFGDSVLLTPSLTTDNISMMESGYFSLSTNSNYNIRFNMAVNQTLNSSVNTDKVWFKTYLVNTLGVAFKVDSIAYPNTGVTIVNGGFAWQTQSGNLSQTMNLPSDTYKVRIVFGGNCNTQILFDKFLFFGNLNPIVGTCQMMPLNKPSFKSTNKNDGTIEFNLSLTPELNSQVSKIIVQKSAIGSNWQKVIELPVKKNEEGKDVNYKFITFFF